MPLKLSGRHYANNVGYCDLLFGSFRHFGFDLLSELAIVVVPEEADLVAQYATAWSDFPIRIIIEDELLPVFKRFSRPHQIRPWHRQQMIKMAYSTEVGSGTYLSLDPDVIAVKPILADQLFPDGRPLLDRASRHVHPQWWIDSARLLGVDPDLDSPSVHATPILYSAGVWARCFERLEEVWGKPWAETLITEPGVWTEMGLYGHTLENFFEPERVHSIGSAVHLHSSVEFWTTSDFEEKELSVLFADDNTGLFGVLSSSCQVDPHQLADRLAPWIPIQIQPYEIRDSLPIRARELYGKIGGGIVREAGRRVKRRQRSGPVVSRPNL